MKITFEKTTVTPTGSLSQLPPIELPRLPQALRPPSNTGSGEFEVTYIDDDTRITRGDKGELRVFVISWSHPSATLLFLWKSLEFSNVVICLRKSSVLTWMQLYRECINTFTGIYVEKTQVLNETPFALFSGDEYKITITLRYHTWHHWYEPRDLLGCVVWCS